MKTQIKSSILCCIALLMVSVTNAQDKGQKQEVRKEKQAARFDEMSKKLNLTSDQQTKIKEIMTQNRTEMKALKEANKDKAKEEQRKAMLGQLKKADGQVNEVLDAKQKEQYKQLKAERKKEMKEKRKEKMKDNEELEDYQGVL